MLPPTQREERRSSASREPNGEIVSDIWKRDKVVGSEVLTAVVMKSTIFWDITPCSPLLSTDVSEEHIASIFRAEE
jgi:hypothetical protein